MFHFKRRRYREMKVKHRLEDVLCSGTIETERARRSYRRVTRKLWSLFLRCGCPQPPF